MPKNFHYIFLAVSLIVLSGCETLNGAATGFGKDVQNTSDPNKNGWNALNDADSWMQENLW